MAIIRNASVSVTRAPLQSGRLSRAIRTVAAMFRRQPRQRRRPVRNLHHLSEHIRRDIGLSP